MLAHRSSWVRIAAGYGWSLARFSGRMPTSELCPLVLLPYEPDDPLSGELEHQAVELIANAPGPRACGRGHPLNPVRP
jgi:hypothetical protein